MQFAIVEPQPERVEALFFGPPMPSQLAISIGQYSDKGRKDTNQDFHGALIPEEPLLSLKGIAIVLADGISTSEVSGVASESAVKSFLTDYYCTSDSWSVKTSAQRVIAATNSWLHAQTRQSQYLYDNDRGYVCTLSAMVIKSATAHIFHIGDARIYRVAGHNLEQLTEDHRVIVSSQQSYLGRALGINPQIEIDYRAVTVEKGDLFLFATDGVYEHVSGRFIAETIEKNAGDLDGAARTIVAEAKRQGSPDNLTVQIVRIDALPDTESSEIIRQASELPCPPLPEPRTVLDGYRIVREIHGSSRSHIYLAVDTADSAMVAVEDSVNRPARRPCVSATVHDGGVGGPARQQRSRPEGPHPVKTAKLPLRRDGIRRRADPDPVDDRQSQPEPGNGARDCRADRQRVAGIPPAGDAAPGPAAQQHHDRQDRDG